MDEINLITYLLYFGMILRFVGTLYFLCLIQWFGFSSSQEEFLNLPRAQRLRVLFLPLKFSRDFLSPGQLEKARRLKRLEIFGIILVLCGQLYWWGVYNYIDRASKVVSEKVSDLEDHCKTIK